MKINLTVFLASVLLIILPSAYTLNNKLSLHTDIETLHKGKVVRVKADIYYNYNDGVMISHYTYPEDYLKISNQFGETKIYYPSKNEVSLIQNEGLSSQNDVLYFFMSNRLEDLGLRDYNFSITKTSFEDGMMVKNWQAPKNSQDDISNVKIVYENYAPIYVAYYNFKNTISRKTYYSQYTNIGGYKIPCSITEISYIGKNDSIISRKKFSNLYLDDVNSDKYFNFKIPQNAKVIKISN